MIYRELKKSGEIYGFLEAIKAREAQLPRWFRDASKAWAGSPTEESRIEHSGEIYGFFDDDELKACVYIEKQEKPSEMMIHLSIIGPLDKTAFMEATGRFRNDLFRRGVYVIRGWVLRRNIALLRLLDAIGFLRTGARLDHGTSHGHILRWELVEVRRG